MNRNIPEKNKQAGLCYALTDEGVELPIIDLSHRAFARARLAPDQLERLVAKTKAEQERSERLPHFVRSSLRWFLCKHSILLQEIMGSEEPFTSGITTYLMKLGADNLGEGYIRKLDKKVANSLPAYSVQQRLRDAVGLTVDRLRPRLGARPDAPLRFLNIAGGPCADSLNALLLLSAEDRELLIGRDIHIDVFDLDHHGPAFAQRALDALRAPDAALANLPITMNHHAYDWRAPAPLRAHLAAIAGHDSIVAVTSEGGLGDYGRDEDLLANLVALEETPPDTVVVLSITPPAWPMAFLKANSTARIVPRDLPALAGLAARSGWALGESAEQPMSIVVALQRS